LLTKYNNIRDCLLTGRSDRSPYHACAVHKWYHRLTACVKASGEHFDSS